MQLIQIIRNREIVAIFSLPLQITNIWSFEQTNYDLCFYWKNESWGLQINCLNEFPTPAIGRGILFQWISANGRETLFLKQMQISPVLFDLKT